MAVAAVLDHAKIEAGSLAVISQSGTMLGALLSRGQARGMGFSRLISVGNEADLTVGEIADLLIDDPASTTILLFLETLREPDKLAAMARRAYRITSYNVCYTKLLRRVWQPLPAGAPRARAALRGAVAELADLVARRQDVRGFGAFIPALLGRDVMPGVAAGDLLLVSSW